MTKRAALVAVVLAVSAASSADALTDVPSVLDRCKPEIARYCGGAPKGAATTCLYQHGRTGLSSGCQDALREQLRDQLGKGVPPAAAAGASPAGRLPQELAACAPEFEKICKTYAEPGGKGDACLRARLDKLPAACAEAFRVHRPERRKAK